MTTKVLSAIFLIFGTFLSGCKDHSSNNSFNSPVPTDSINLHVSTADLRSVDLMNYADKRLAEGLNQNKSFEAKFNTKDDLILIRLFNSLAEHAYHEEIPSSILVNIVSKEVLLANLGNAISEPTTNIGGLSGPGLVLVDNNTSMHGTIEILAHEYGHIKDNFQRLEFFAEFAGLRSTFDLMKYYPEVYLYKFDPQYELKFVSDVLWHPFACSRSFRSIASTNGTVVSTTHGFSCHPGFTVKFKTVYKVANPDPSEEAVINRTRARLMRWFIIDKFDGDLDKSQAYYLNNSLETIQKDFHKFADKFGRLDKDSLVPTWFIPIELTRHIITNALNKMFDNYLASDPNITPTQLNELKKWLVTI